MAKTKDIIKSIVNVTLGFCTFLVFNENPENILPNIIGVASFALLIYFNKDNN